MFQIIGQDLWEIGQPIPITSGQTVAVGDILRLTSNRLRRAVSGGTDWYGLCVSTSEGDEATGNAGGTITARVAAFRGTPPQMVATYASSVAPGDTLDLGADASSLAASSDVDFIVDSYDSASQRAFVQISANRLHNGGVPSATALTADDIAAVTGAAGTPSASEPFATLAALSAGRLYVATVAGAAAAGLTAAVTSKNAAATPAAGDKIIAGLRFVTATGAFVSALTIGATDFEAALVSSSGIKATQISATDMSASTIVFLIAKQA